MEDNTENKTTMEFKITKWSAQFDTGTKIITVSLPFSDLDKLAEAFYNICIDNKIDATIEIKDKNNGKEEDSKGE